MLADERLVDAVLDDYREAPICEGLRQTLAFLEALIARPAGLNLADVADAKAAGVTEAALGDAAQICAAFTVLNKLADAFGWDILSEESYAERAASSLERGYLVSEDLLE